MSFNVEAGEFVQIIHDATRSHWVTVSTVGLEHPHLNVFDSLFSQASESLQMQAACLLYTEKTYISLMHVNVQKQCGAVDCGLYSIAFATALIFGQEPSKFHFDQTRMWSHLLECFNKGKISMFPVKRARRCTKKITRINLIEVYCICRLPKFVDSEWIQCSKCSSWYHSGTCIKVPDKYLGTKLPWYCFKCCI